MWRMAKRLDNTDLDHIVENSRILDVNGIELHAMVFKIIFVYFLGCRQRSPAYDGVILISFRRNVIPCMVTT